MNELEQAMMFLRALRIEYGDRLEDVELRLMLRDDLSWEWFCELEMSGSGYIHGGGSSPLDAATLAAGMLRRV